MVYGFLEQVLDKDYKVRSYMLVESFLVKKKDLKGRERELVNRNFDWFDNLHGGANSISCYFGELYWADTIPVYKPQEGYIASENEIEIEHTLDFRDVVDNYPDYNIGDKVKEIIKEPISFEIEPTIIEYYWETESDIYRSQRSNIPSPNIGRKLGLKADATNLQILDKDDKLAFQTIKFNEDKKVDQHLNYIRTDLLAKYMEDNGLVLLYQIKQHTYDRLAGDGSGDFRGMKYFFPHLGQQNFE